MNPIRRIANFLFDFDNELLIARYLAHQHAYRLGMDMGRRLAEQKAEQYWRERMAQQRRDMQAAFQAQLQAMRERDLAAEPSSP